MPGRHLLQIELQAARQHGDRYLLRVRGREDELHVRRRLFQRLEHRVERMPGELMHFVDHVDLVAAAGRRIGRLVQQRSHVVDAAVARGVHLDVIDEAPRIDLLTGRADPAGRRGNTGFAVQRLGQDARDRGLADPPRTGKEPGVVQAAGGERMRQRAHHMLLPDEGVEAFRAPFARQHQVTHAGDSSRGPEGARGLLTSPTR